MSHRRWSPALLTLITLLPAGLAFSQPAGLPAATRPATQPSTVGRVDPEIIAAGDWSEEAAGLRGRLVIAASGGPSTEPGRLRNAAVYLDLRFSPRAFAKPLNVYFDPDIDFELRDSRQQVVTREPGGFGGGRPGAEWVRLPFDSTVRLRLTPYGIAGTDALRIVVNRASWSIKSADAGTYTFEGAFSSTPPADPAWANPWQGTLKLPPVKLAMAEILARPAIPFVEIHIESHPKGWGLAQKTARPDGHIAGAHMSGGPDAVRVFESEAQMSPQDLADLLQHASELQSHPPQTQAIPDDHADGFLSLVLVGPGANMSFRTSPGQPFASPEAQAIWDLLAKYNAGGW
jgi:hypothetical protein